MTRRFIVDLLDGDETDKFVDKYGAVEVLEQEPCENCCNGNQEEKAKLCQKSYLAGMEHRQAPCDDTISRAAVFDALRTCYDTEKVETVNNGEYISYEQAVSLAERLPSVTPHPKTGHWILKGEGDGFKNWNCSKCGMLVRNSQRPWYKHCPNCGAKMQEVEDADR